jgi:transcriptional regulator with XRE-family HTH domain
MGGGGTEEVQPLKEWRLRRHLSFRMLARAAGVSTDTLLRAEKGARLHELTQRKIADALGIAVRQVREFQPQK